MNLSRFFDSNRTCPICGNHLTLYAQIMDSSLYMESPEHDGGRPGRHFALVDKTASAQHLGKDEVQNNFISLIDDETVFENDPKFESWMTPQIYFYLLCNPAGFKFESYGNYHISLYNGCYYRSSATYNIKKNDNSHIILPKDDVNNEIIVKDEAFSFKKYENAVEKVYMVKLDHEKDKTILWYYAVKDEERKDGFKPNILEKELPILRDGLNMVDYNKIIERLDRWILIS